MKRLSRVVLFVVTIVLTAVFLIGAYIWSKLDLIDYSEEDHHVVSDEVFEEYVADLGDLEITNEAPAIPDTEVTSSKQVKNILILGTDERTTDFHYAARSDSMILVSIDCEKQTVKLVSFERAVGVPILEGEFEGQYDLLTHIFRWGGSELVVKTIEHCFKIDIDNFIRVNFNSVRNIVDTVDGIDI